MEYYLGVDQGTTNTKVVLFDGKKIIAKATERLPIKITNEGWVEQDPVKMIKNIISCIKNIIKSSKINTKKIISAGISNQTETLVVWDKKSGKPIIPAISWQCKRSSNLLKKYSNNFNLNEIIKKTGLNLDPTFTATKIFWLKKNYPEIYTKLVNNKYLLGTIDTWIIWNLTSGKVFSTDASNASRTLLCNINNIQWDKSLLDQFEIKKIILPEIKKNQDIYGEIDKKFFGSKIKISASIGDQQASLYGNGCLKKGDLKITLGTGAFLWLNKGNKFNPSNNKSCLDTLAWFIKKPVYASEGFILMAGALLDYFTNNLNIAKNFKHLENKALKLKKTNIYIIPSMLGLGTPWWSQKHCGSIYGLNANTSNEDICLSAFETVGFQIKAAFDALKKNSNIKIKQINVDGKLSSSKLMKGILSNLIGKNLNFSLNEDITALGAALLACNNNTFFKNKTIKHSLNEKEMNDYINNKYVYWKKLTDNIIKF